MTEPTAPFGHPRAAGEESATDGRPLAGCTVVDLTAALAGPFATLLLAELGARVIKVENPRGGETVRNNAPYHGRDGVSLSRRHDDDMSVTLMQRSRGKLGVTLDLKHPDGRAVFADLVRQADVVVDNFAAGTLERLGIGYEFGSTINPRVIYTSISGFGRQGGPGTGKAMDSIIQALSGIMWTSGGPDDPPVRVGIPLGDLLAPLYGVIGTLAALHDARRTGRGTQVDVSMLGALTSFVAAEPFELLESLGVPQRTGLTVPRLAPFGIFRAEDGYFALCAPTEAFAVGVFEALGRPDLADDDRYSSRDRRVVNSTELHGLIGTWAAGRTVAQAVDALSTAGVPAAEVRTPAEAVRDPLVRARGEVVPAEHPVYGPVDGVVGPGLPICFGDFTDSIKANDQPLSPAPLLGEHNEHVYGDILGYTPEAIADLRARSVI